MNIVSFSPIYNFSIYQNKSVSRPVFKADATSDVFVKSNPDADIETRAKLFADDLYKLYSHKEQYTIDNIKKLVHQYSKRTSVKNEFSVSEDAAFEQDHFFDKNNKIHSNCYKLKIDFNEKDKNPKNFYTSVLHEMIHNFQQKDGVLLMNRLYNPQYSQIAGFNSYFFDKTSLGAEEANDVIDLLTKSKLRAFLKLNKICNKSFNVHKAEQNSEWYEFDKYSKLIELCMLKAILDDEYQAYSLSSELAKQYVGYNSGFDAKIAKNIKIFSGVVGKKISNLQNSL